MLALISFLILHIMLQCVVARLCWLAWHSLQQGESQVDSVRVRLAEISCLADARLSLRNKQKKFEHAVDSTTDSVETVHRVLADLSFDLWGSEDGRQRHKQSADQVYGSVRGANRLFGKWAGSFLGEDSSDKNKDS